MNNPFVPLDLSAARKILAIQPHYGDNDVAAGGTLAAPVENGAELIYLTVTDDLVGVVDQSLSDDEMATRLRDDQERTGEIISVREHYFFKTVPEVDENFEPCNLKGIAFYHTAYPNQIFDITPTREKKHRAVNQYRTQFTEEDVATLLSILDQKEWDSAEGNNF